MIFIAIAISRNKHLMEVGTRILKVRTKGVKVKWGKRFKSGDKEVRTVGQRYKKAGQGLWDNDL